MMKIVKFAIAALVLGLASYAQTRTAPATFAYIGTYTGEKSKGIYLYRLPSQGTPEPLGLAAETPNPSFLELDPQRRLLFAVNETGEFGGKPTGGVSAFSIDAAGKLKLLNQRSSMGKDPCHLVLDRTGRNMLVANYSSGSVAVLPVQRDGKLGEASEVIQHQGKSVDPERQTGPHAHCVTLDRANRFAFVCDLGLDKVMIYRFDAERGKLKPHEPAFAALKAGAGPRHMVFGKDGRFAYVINEMNSTVTVFAYDSNRGVLKELQSVSTLPKNWEGANTTAEVAVHPSGKFLYASNRGHNTVAVFRIDPATGTLTWVEEHSTGGATPRHFGIDPSGQTMVIANQASSTVLMLRIAADGRLKPVGGLTDAPTPVCVKFLPSRE
jgi:6-phosphogluconolactonase